MWQLHWMVSLIPDAVLNLVYWAFIIGGITGVAAGWLSRWIPFYGKYAKILKPIGFVLVILGVYLRGGYDTEMAWRAKAAELQAKVATAEAESKQANADLDKALKDKKGKTKQVQVVIQTRIKEVEKKIDADCKVDPDAISIMNDAAHNRGGK